MPSHENTFVIFKTDEGRYLAVTPEGQALLTKTSSPAAIFEMSRKGDTTSRIDPPPAHGEPASSHPGW